MKVIVIFVLLICFCGNGFSQVCQTNYKDLKDIVVKMGWRVSSEMGGPHNARSKHYRGKAIDVSVKGRTTFHMAMLTEVLTKWGYIVVDERKRPRGQKVWTAPHFHISVPDCY
jgi:hypothetical protein